MTLLMAGDWRAKDIWIPSRERIREREEMMPQGEKEEKRWGGEDRVGMDKGRERESS